MKLSSDPKRDTRREILDLAEELWLTRGFNAFSYQHISSVLGVRNAAIHYHFPSKTDLGVELIQRYQRRLQRVIEAQSPLPAYEQLQGYFQLSAVYYQNDQQVCPSGILATEFQTLPELMQTEATAFIEQMRHWSTQIVEKGQQEGSMRYAGSAQGMGAILFSSLQGGLQLARVNSEALVLIKQQIIQLLGIVDR